MPYTRSEQVRKTVSKFAIEFYERENDDIPVEEFLLSLDKKMRAKILRIMGILQEKGNQLREPYSKHLDDGIFEIRGESWNRHIQSAVFLLL